MADGDEHVNELTQRMRHRYQVLCVDQNDPPNVYTVFAALADEVRQYDREQRARAYADEHAGRFPGYKVAPTPLLPMHTPASDCGICALAAANAVLAVRDGGVNPS